MYEKILSLNQDEVNDYANVDLLYDMIKDGI